MLLVRPRKIQHPLPDDPKAPNDLIKLSPYSFCSFYSTLYKNHTLKYSIGYARTTVGWMDDIIYPDLSQS